jgi:hypothetical protein
MIDEGSAPVHVESAGILGSHGPQLVCSLVQLLAMLA